MRENLSRRNFLGKSALTGAGLAAAGSTAGLQPDASANPAQGTESPGRPGTILALGAHYDDCPFGIPGTLLEAVQKNYRVVILNIIGDYSNWAPVSDRVEELRNNSIRLAEERGMEMRFLNYASMKFANEDQTQSEIAEVVAEVQPDIAFMLWRRDRHPDHEVASLLCEAALRQPAAILGRSGPRPPRRIYYYDNGPGHTVEFTPDTYLDISEYWTAAMEWLGENMAFVRKQEYDPGNPDGALLSKEKLARYRGSACGVGYAEALLSYNPYPTRIL